MQNLFVSPDDEFIVNFSVAIDKKENTIFCDLEKGSLTESLESMGKDPSDFTLGEYQAIFKKPSFGDSMAIYSEIFSVDAEGVNFNPVVARYNKISALIKSWNLKGKDEKPTDEEIKQLHPIIANAMGTMVDLETGGIFN